MIDRCGCGVLAIVGELYGEVEISALDECLHFLKIIAALAAHPELVALNLRTHAPRPLVPNQLGDLLRVLLANAFLRTGRDLVELAR